MLRQGCARVSLCSGAPQSQHIDGVDRAGSAGTKSGSSARSLVLLTMLAPRRREPHGSRAGPAIGLDVDEANSQFADGYATRDHGQLSSPWRSGRRFASFQRQRGPAALCLVLEKAGSAPRPLYSMIRARRASRITHTMFFSPRSHQKQNFTLAPFKLPRSKAKGM